MKKDEKRMGEHIILEVCVDSVESALAAVAGGADRLELCGNLIVGGTTPDIHLYEEIRRCTNIPVRVLIRPRFGDFCYSEYEYHIMEKNIRDFAKMGAEGLVIGVLDCQGNLDMQKMKGLIHAADGKKCTLHRAFDVSENPFETLQQAIELGMDTILTSGQENNCLTGKVLLKKLVEKAGEEITIMPGGGIGPDTIEEVCTFTGAKAYHMSGKKVLDSRMIYRKENVPMGLPGISEYEIWQTDVEQVRYVRGKLDILS